VSLYIFLFAGSLVYAGLLFLTARMIWGKRIKQLEQDLQHFSEAMGQMAEIQTRTYRKLSGTLGSLEERILDLSLPTNDPNLPLERRHNVLALARKGASIDEIVSRLRVPRGEAELILDLRKYMDSGSGRAATGKEKVIDYAEA
jgi:hypothetical protein